MGCLLSKSEYKKVSDMNYKDDERIDLEKHHSLSSPTMYRISTQIIRKIFCHFIRGTNSENVYFTNISFTNNMIDIITGYIDDFFKFSQIFKYSQIFLSNNNKTATILMTKLIDQQPNYENIGDRLILYGLPIFPRKNYIYSLTLKIDKCSYDTIAISFISDYFYFLLNYLRQKHIKMNILNHIPIKYGSYTIWCNGKETKTWNHYQQNKPCYNYLDDINNIDFGDNDKKANIFSNAKKIEFQFEMFQTVIITVDGFKNLVEIENKTDDKKKKLILNIPKCYKSCLCEEDHFDKTDNLNNNQYNQYNNEYLEDYNNFIYPTKHNPQFQIAFILYDGDNSHAQISVIDQSWSYLT